MKNGKVPDTVGEINEDNYIFVPKELIGVLDGIKNRMIVERQELVKVAMIIACLAVTTMFAACDGTNPDDGNGNGNGRELNANEKELVGKYSYGSYGSGYWAYYSYNYDQWKDAFTYASW